MADNIAYLKNLLANGSAGNKIWAADRLKKAPSVAPVTTTPTPAPAPVTPVTPAAAPTKLTQNDIDWYLKKANEGGGNAVYAKDKLKNAGVAIPTSTLAPATNGPKASTTPTIDYSAAMINSANAGTATAASLEQLLAARNLKLQDPQYAKFANPEFDKMMGDYITSLKAPEVPVTPEMDIQALIDQKLQAAETQALNANQYAVDTGVNDLMANLESTGASFDASRNQNAVDTSTMENNLALRSAMNGDRGGIGQMQYGQVQSASDARALEINLAQKKLTADTQKQIIDLKAQGRFQDAQTVLDIAQKKMDALINEQIRLSDNATADAQFAVETDLKNQTNQTAAEEAKYNKAMTRLELGIFSVEDALTLGIPEAEALRITTLVKDQAKIDLAQAKKTLLKAASGGGGGGGSETMSYGQMLVQIQNSKDPMAEFNNLNATQKLAVGNYDALFAAAEEAALLLGGGGPEYTGDPNAQNDRYQSAGINYLSGQYETGKISLSAFQAKLKESGYYYNVSTGAIDPIRPATN